MLLGGEAIVTVMMYVMNILQRGPCSQGAMKSEACKLIRAENLQAVCMYVCYLG